MEHRLTAKLAGTVSAVHVAEGDQVGDGMVLVEIGDPPRSGRQFQHEGHTKFTSTRWFAIRRGAA